MGAFVPTILRSGKMSKYSKAKGRSTKRPFVNLRYDIMDSPAWLSLSCKARVAWTEVVRRYNGTNNGEIPLSCRELAVRANIGKGTAKKAFDELIEAGFIKIGRDSNFNYKMKEARRWIVTHQRYQDKPATNEWKDSKRP